MQPLSLMDNHSHPQLTLESATRANRRRKCKDVDAEIKRRTIAGRKPNQVQVKAGGEIAGGCDGKNAWESSVRSIVPRTLDMSMLSWRDQSPSALAELTERLDRDFEYVEYNLSEQGFRNAVKRFMKTEQSRLKTRYLEGHTKCPLHIDEE
jgi:hypothetical protein